ncbi:unnamed protein product [Trifolium pratense]|uniref:Uncharacterized protein n=1 Tax=Trifolium pratense TaxID=57577 RepID=A0ACB0MAX5_TRIPR|nr:unnamed protein product [Trifolium pratense]
MSASQSNANKPTGAGDHVAYSFLNNLDNATNESSIKVCIARMWDNLQIQQIFKASYFSDMETNRMCI